MSELPLQRPVVLYDGECGFCKRHVARWSALGKDRVEFLTSQEHGQRFPQVTKEQLDRAVYLIEPDGSVTHGAEAVFRIAALSRKRLWRWLCENLPGFANLSEIGYRFIASHRNLVDPIDRALFGSSHQPTSHRLTVSIFLRALGVVYLVAFLSLWVQIHGLVGSHGILPFAPVVESLKQLPASTRYLNLPTLCWIDSSDAALSFYCAAGVVMSVLLIAGVLPFFMLVGFIAISILDDSFWPRRIRRPPKVYRDQPWWTIAIRAPAAIVIVLLTSVAFAEVCRMDLDRWPRLTQFYHRAEPFRSTNWYALFRTMTQTRIEIVIEGSDDGEHWRIYDFKYKPGPVDRRPEFVTPHMPRLDWQMWFEGVNASEGGSPSRWFVLFLQRLLEGSPQVTQLLRTNPFPNHPPKYVHALRYEYHFADDPKGKAWWKRTLLGEYVPTVRLSTSDSP